MMQLLRFLIGLAVFAGLLLAMCHVQSKFENWLDRRFGPRDSQRHDDWWED